MFGTYQKTYINYRNWELFGHYIFTLLLKQSNNMNWQALYDLQVRYRHPGIFASHPGAVILKEYLDYRALYYYHK